MPTYVEAMTKKSRNHVERKWGINVQKKIVKVSVSGVLSPERWLPSPPWQSRGEILYHLISLEQKSRKLWHKEGKRNLIFHKHSS